MPNTADADLADLADLVEGGAGGRVNARAAGIAGLLVIVFAVVAIAAFLFGRATAVDRPKEMTGEMVLGPVSRAEAGRSAVELGNAATRMSGTVRFVAGGSTHTGTVRVHASRSADTLGATPVGSPRWGAVEVLLDADRCTGASVWTYLARDDDDGSFHLHCESGRFLAGVLAVAAVDRSLSGDGSWRVSVRVKDGFYLAP